MEIHFYLQKSHPLEDGWGFRADVCHPTGWGDHVASMIPGWPGWQDVFWRWRCGMLTYSQCSIRCYAMEVVKGV